MARAAHCEPSIPTPPRSPDEQSSVKTWVHLNGNSCLVWSDNESWTIDMGGRGETCQTSLSRLCISACDHSVCCPYVRHGGDWRLGRYPYRRRRPAARGQ